MTLQQLAQDARRSFERADRSDPTTDRREYWRIKTGAPEWVTALVRDAGHAHAAILPDDYRYDYVVDALDLLADGGDPDEIAAEIEADPYTGELTAWLASSARRLAYLDEARETYGPDLEASSLLACGQVIERCEVFHAVREFLADMVEEEVDA